MRQIFFDTETTGLYAENGDRIVELGCVEMVDRRLTGRTLHLYLNPERPSDPEAARVHGLSDEFLAQQKRFAEVADEFLAFVQGAELVIHNAAFDVGFVNAELARLGRGALHEVVSGLTDTLALARDTWPGKANSLDALCRRLEVDNSSRTVHGALLDAGLLAEVYIRMTRGQGSLVIDDGDGPGAAHELIAVDFAALVLPVLRATEAEAAAHALVMTEVAKASGGKRVWHDADAADAARQTA